MTKHAAAFFAFARERHSIHLRRRAGQPWPWTDDHVLRKYSFTNVFRELDKTTVWWRAVSDTIRDKPEVLLATVLFRWFNRITTGEAIFKQLCLRTPAGTEGKSAYDLFLGSGDISVLKDSILTYCGRGPYVTGSYIILGQQGMPKLDGVLACLAEFYSGEWCWDDQMPPDTAFRSVTQNCDWLELAHFLLQNRGQISLEQVWRWLRRVPYLGDFMAYEIVTDLRHTDLLCDAPDIMTWANPGPGAARGLARVHGRDINGRKITKVPKRQLVAEMRELLALSQSPEYWPQAHSSKSGHYWVTGYTVPFLNVPQSDGAWPALEMRDIEHTLCEFDKYRRAQTGEGRPRGTYRHV